MRLYNKILERIKDKHIDKAVDKFIHAQLIGYASPDTIEQYIDEKIKESIERHINNQSGSVYSNGCKAAVEEITARVVENKLPEILNTLDGKTISNAVLLGASKQIMGKMDDTNTLLDSAVARQRTLSNNSFY